MSGIVKLVLTACVGFSVPIGLALLVAPQLFPRAIDARTFSGEAYSRAALGIPSGAREADRLPDADGPSAAATGAQDSSGTAASVRTVATDRGFDPEPGKVFVVSFLFRVENLPRQGKRQKIIYKYDNDKKPFAGWAIALRRLDSSTRPEVYWQSGAGDGGWYSFDHFNLKKRTWYAATFTARPGDYMNLYIREFPTMPDGTPDRTPADESDEPSVGVTPVGEVVFSGGYALTGIETPVTDAPLQFAARQSGGGEMRLELAELAIGAHEDFPTNPERIRPVLQGEFADLLRLLPETSLALHIDPSGADKSPAARPIS